jgi:hypothetical protein
VTNAATFPAVLHFKKVAYNFTKMPFAQIIFFYVSYFKSWKAKPERNDLEDAAVNGKIMLK